jgi:hypothetical protein
VRQVDRLSAGPMARQESSKREADLKPHNQQSGAATSRKRSTDCRCRDHCMRRRTVDTEGYPQFGRSHDPHVRVGLKAPLKFVDARNQIPKLHRFGFRHYTAIAETSVVRQKLLHTLLYDRFCVIMSPRRAPISHVRPHERR